jgi:hypothetical protein
VTVQGDIMWTVRGDSQHVEFWLPTGHPAEVAAFHALQGPLERGDLDRVVFSDLLKLERGRAAWSWPVLSIGCDYASNEELLAAFVHEQVHWWVEANRQRLETVRPYLEERWPSPPEQRAGGASSIRSTWEHLVVCHIERAFVSRLMTERSHRALYRSLRTYWWIYQQVEENEAWLTSLVDDHRLALPNDPPVGRRSAPVAELGQCGPALFAAGEDDEWESSAVDELTSFHGETSAVSIFDRRPRRVVVLRGGSTTGVRGDVVLAPTQERTVDIGAYCWSLCIQYLGDAPNALGKACRTLEVELGGSRRGRDWWRLLALLLAERLFPAHLDVGSQLIDGRAELERLNVALDEFLANAGSR